MFKKILFLSLFVIIYSINAFAYYSIDNIPFIKLSNDTCDKNITYYTNDYTITNYYNLDNTNYALTNESETFEKDLTVTEDFKVPNLINCNTIDTDANGNLSCGSDETGSGGWTDSDSLMLLNNSDFINETHLTETLDVSNYTAGSNITILNHIISIDFTELKTWLDSLYATIGSYLTPQQGNDTYQKLEDINNSYPDNINLSNTLGNYPTNENQSITLSNYPTNENISTTLQYYTDTDTSSTKNCTGTQILIANGTCVPDTNYVDTITGVLESDLSTTMLDYWNETKILNTMNGYINETQNAANFLGYPNNSNLSNTLAVYIEQVALGIMLANYINESQNAINLLDYANNTNLSETFGAYQIAGDYISIVTLLDYPNNTNLSNTLEFYVTAINLSNTLAEYPTNINLSNTLQQYTDTDTSAPKNCTGTQILLANWTCVPDSNYVDVSNGISEAQLAETMLGYSNNTNLSTTLAVYTVNSSLSNYDTWAHNQTIVDDVDANLTKTGTILGINGANILTWLNAIFQPIGAYLTSQEGNDTYQKLEDINNSYALNSSLTNYDTYGTYNQTIGAEVYAKAYADSIVVTSTQLNDSYALNISLANYDLYNYNMTVGFAEFQYNMTTGAITYTDEIVVTSAQLNASYQLIGDYLTSTQLNESYALNSSLSNYDIWAYNQTTGAITYVDAQGFITSTQANNSYARTDSTNIFTSNQTLSDELIISANKNIYFNSQKIYSNTSCMIIVGTTVQMEVC